MTRRQSERIDVNRYGNLGTAETTRAATYEARVLKAR
jgi:hypothetical protein